MHGLEAILIVTNSSRGHHFVYKYPREGNTYSSGRQNSSGGTGSGTGSNINGSTGGGGGGIGVGNNHNTGSNGNSSNSNLNEHRQKVLNVLGYDSQFLSNLLSPKLSLCDKRFQLSVDDLTFVGHPVGLTGPEFTSRREYWQWRALRPKKRRPRRGWSVQDANLDEENDEDDAEEDSDLEDYEEFTKQRQKEKETKSRINTTGSGIGGGKALLNESTELASLPEGSNELDPEHEMQKSVTDPSSWGTQRTRQSTLSHSIPGSPLFLESAGHVTQTPATMTPSWTHTAVFAPQSLLHHPVSLPQTPTLGLAGNPSMVPPPALTAAASAAAAAAATGGVPTNTMLVPINTNILAPGTTSNALGYQTYSATQPHFQQMSFFHVVFVLKPQELQLNDAADKIYRNVACKLTAALRYEELSSQYVSKETTKILGLREEWVLSGQSSDVFHDRVAEASSLARIVRVIYDSIKADKVCHVVLNDSIDLSLQIPLLAPLTTSSSYFSRSLSRTANTPSTQLNTATNGSSLPNGPDSPTATRQGGIVQSGSTSQLQSMTPNTSLALQQQAQQQQQQQQQQALGLMDDFEMGVAYEYENFPVLCPYHTLLMLEDPEEILKDIPLDANPTLVKLVQILVPYQCLDELQYILDCSMAQIYRLASHLIYWRKAKLIDQIRVSNVYVVASQAEITESIMSDFAQHFPSLSLPNLLHELSTPKSFKQHIPGLGKDKEVQTVYLEMLTFLLRKDLVVQLHTYILIMVPEYIKRNCTIEEYELLLAEEQQQHILQYQLHQQQLLLQQQGRGTDSGGANIVTGGSSAPKASTTTTTGSMTPQKVMTAEDWNRQLVAPDNKGSQQQTLPNQRFHQRSSTGPGGSSSATSGGGVGVDSPSTTIGFGTGATGSSVGHGMSTSVKSHLSERIKIAGRRQDASSILPNPGQATEQEREWVIRMTENQPHSVAELFTRLVHYFDGKHHVEEILFREQIVAKDLKTVLTAFRDFLILTWA